MAVTKKVVKKKTGTTPSAKRKPAVPVEPKADPLVLAVKAASAAYVKAVLSALAEEAKGQLEVTRFLETAYQRLVAGGGTDGGDGTKGLGSDPESTGS